PAEVCGHHTTAAERGIQRAGGGEADEDKVSSGEAAHHDPAAAIDRHGIADISTCREVGYEFAAGGERSVEHTCGRVASDGKAGVCPIAQSADNDAAAAVQSHGKALVRPAAEIRGHFSPAAKT